MCLCSCKLCELLELRRFLPQLCDDVSFSTALTRMMAECLSHFFIADSYFLPVDLRVSCELVACGHTAAVLCVFLRSASLACHCLLSPHCACLLAVPTPELRVAICHLRSWWLFGGSASDEYVLWIRSSSYRCPSQGRFLPMCFVQLSDEALEAGPSTAFDMHSILAAPNQHVRQWTTDASASRAASECLVREDAQHLSYDDHRASKPAVEELEQQTVEFRCASTCLLRGLCLAQRCTRVPACGPHLLPSDTPRVLPLHAMNLAMSSNHMQSGPFRKAMFACAAPSTFLHRTHNIVVGFLLLSALRVAVCLYRKARPVGANLTHGSGAASAFQSYALETRTGRTQLMTNLRFPRPGRPSHLVHCICTTAGVMNSTFGISFNILSCVVVSHWTRFAVCSLTNVELNWPLLILVILLNVEPFARLQSSLLATVSS